MGTRVHPVKWVPPPDPGLAGEYEENDLLASVERWDTPGDGPEDVVVDGEGQVFCGLANGRIVRLPPGGGVPTIIAETGGRPLGIELLDDGSLLVCDAHRGLLRIEGGSVEVLADSYDGERFLFTNNAAVASDGSIYVSVSSRRFPLDEFRSDLIEHSNTGRLFRYLSDSGNLELLLDGLSFANGVALSRDDSFVAFAETGEYRISRLWLTGDRAGTREALVDVLPGIPDNLSTGPDGTIWAAMFTPRNRQLDLLMPRPRIRKVVAMLPEKIQPQPVRHGFVVGYDAAGQVVHNLQDPAGVYAPITGVRQHGGRLYLGSLTEPALGVIDLP